MIPSCRSSESISEKDTFQPLDILFLPAYLGPALIRESRSGPSAPRLSRFRSAVFPAYLSTAFILPGELISHHLIISLDERVNLPHLCLLPSFTRLINIFRIVIIRDALSFFYSYHISPFHNIFGCTCLISVRYFRSRSRN